jgi:hypothetical protein
METSLKLPATLLACAIFLIAVYAWSTSPTEGIGTDITATISFRCLWWSTAQMEGLNPNAPPPKTTEVMLQKWAYTDPIGVPHPDVVDVVVELKNHGDQPVESLDVRLTGRWRVGPMTSQSRAAWEKPIVLWTDTISVGPQYIQNIRVPVHIATKMAELAKARRWPWALQVNLLIRQAGGERPLLTREVDFTIRPGD